jgi:hypothetical protein
LDLQTELELKTNMPDNDILAAILHILKGLPISWTSTHVRGHQDDMGKELSHFEQLNCKMDILAKQALASYQPTPVTPLEGEHTSCH